MIDPGLQQSSQAPQAASALGSFYLNPHAVMANGDALTANGNIERRDAMAATETGNSEGRSSSKAHKKRSKKRGSSSRTSGGVNLDDYISDMPIPSGGGGGVDPFGQLAKGMRNMNLYGGFPKGGDLTDLLIDRRADRSVESPGSLGDPYYYQNRGHAPGLPHPMMMMPGQQNLMTNFLTPSLMMKTPPSYNLNSDYSSLPPAINLSGHSGEGIDSGIGGNGGGGRGGLHLEKADRRARRNDKPRFGSDPGEPSDNENVSSSLEGTSAARRDGNLTKGSSSKGNDSRSTSSGTGASGGSSSSDSQHRHGARSSHMSEPTGRILGTLLEQINLLHETNSKICRNLHDTKVEIEALKHAPSWGLRHRRDSISGLSTHSQPVGYGFGTQSPAPASYHSGAYTPGMMTDVVREVREGARVREDAMLNRVKSLVDERTWQANEMNYKLNREVEELKSQVQQLLKEKQDTGHRLTELELEVKTMRIVFGTQLQSLGAANRANPLAMAHPYRTAVDRQMESSTPLSARPVSHLNIKYGVLNEHPMEVLPGGGNEAAAQDLEMVGHLLTSNNSNMTNQSISVNNVESAQASASDHMVMQMEKDTFDLRRELQDAVAGKKQAEQRIQTLEKQMNILQDSLAKKSEPVLNPFSKSQTVSAKFSPSNGEATKFKQHQTVHANTGSTMTTAANTAAGTTPKGNGFLLTGPVTDL